MGGRVDGRDNLSMVKRLARDYMVTYLDRPTARAILKSADMPYTINSTYMMIFHNKLFVLIFVVSPTGDCSLWCSITLDSAVD